MLCPSKLQGRSTILLWQLLLTFLQNIKPLPPLFPQQITTSGISPIKFCTTILVDLHFTWSITNMYYETNNRCLWQWYYHPSNGHQIIWWFRACFGLSNDINSFVIWNIWMNQTHSPGVFSFPLKPCYEWRWSCLGVVTCQIIIKNWRKKLWGFRGVNITIYIAGCVKREYIKFQYLPIAVTGWV